MAKAINAPAAPSWAAGYLGLVVIPEKALRAGWIDQGSSSAHYGIERKKGLWLLKNNSRLPDSCGQTFWRFTLLQVDAKGRIKSISTQVHSVYADGHGEMICRDFMEPSDIHFATVALTEATRAEGTIHEPANKDWFEAARDGKMEVIDRLLKGKADVNAIDEERRTALVFAVQSGRDELVKILLAAGADANKGHANGMTALMLAAHENHVDMVGTLLAAGANANVIAGDSWKTALMIAACPRRNPIIKKLLEAKAHNFLNGKDGKTAAQLYKACKGGDAYNKSIFEALAD